MSAVGKLSSSIESGGLAGSSEAWRYAGAYDTSSGTRVPAEASADETDMWVEEREALEAIYGEEMQILGPSQTLLRVDVHGTRFVLDFRIHPGLMYPSQPPLIGVRYALSLGLLLFNAYT